jgi:hypothetical protein
MPPVSLLVFELFPESDRFLPFNFSVLDLNS